jgi:hypothetical protein
MRIGIDIDGVLANFTGGFSKVVNDLCPGTIPPGYEPKDWNWTDTMTKGMMNQVWQEVRRREHFWLTLQPDEFNILSLRKHLQTHLRDEVYYVTSRVPDGSTYPLLGATNRWLMRYNLLRENTSVIVVRKGEVKGEVYSALNISHSVDDRYDNVAAVSGGHKPYLLNRPWNASFQWASRVESLADFFKEVENGR